MAALVGASTCAVSGCGAGEPQERLGASDEALFGGAAVSRCQWTNVVALNEACSGVLLHPDLVVYAAHCGTSLTRVWSSSQEVAVRDCKALPDAALGGTDLAYCRLATSFSAEIVAPASGCENDAAVPGAPVVMVGFGIDYPDGQFGVRRMSTGVISTVSENEIVVSSPSAGICSGDSGGALLQAIADPAADGGTSYRVVGIASASPDGPCRPSESHYTRLGPYLAWLEKQSGFDVTPCGAADGSWSPTFDCVAPQFTPGAVCNPMPSPAWSGTCGQPFTPSPVDRVLPRVAVARPRADEVIYLDESGKGAVPVAVDASDGGWGVRSVAVDMVDSSSAGVWSEERSVPPYDFGTVTVSNVGTYTLRALVSDYAGNMSGATRSFDVRARAPGCSVARGIESKQGTSPWPLVILGLFALYRRWKKRPPPLLPWIVAMASTACGGRELDSTALDASVPAEAGPVSAEKPLLPNNSGIAENPGATEGKASRADTGPGDRATIFPTNADLSRCPTAEPALGTSCPAEGIVCTYGDSVLFNCRRARACTGGVWTMDSGEDCRGAPAGYCPAEVPAGACIAMSWSGQTLPRNGQVVCPYPDGTSCVCNACETPGCTGKAWHCAAPPSNPGCPPVAPNLGERCGAQGVECDYGVPCQGGEQFICRRAMWYPLNATCPN